MKRTLLGLALGGLMALNSAHAVVNAGFETGDLSGWSTSLFGGSAAVVSSHSTSYGGNATYLPGEGSYFLAIGSGFANAWQTVTQIFNVGAGQTLAGSAAFNWGDYGGYVDGARVRILNSAGGEVSTVFYADGAGHPEGFNGPWTDWSWTAAAAGSYFVEYGARNTSDGGGPEQSFGYFDAAEVPEPTSIALLGAALMGVALSRRKRA